MTFQATETSQDQGSPIEIYEFLLGGEAFRFTTDEVERVVDALTYEPAEISRSRITLGPEQRSDVLEIELPSSNPLVQRYINSVPGQRANLTIRRFHRLDGDDETIVVFKGVIRSAGFTLNGSTSRIAAIPLTAALSRTIPRFTYQGLCNHVLYDTRCKVVQNNFRLQANVSVVSGDEITVPGAAGFGADFFVGGFVSFGAVDFRMVLAQTGDVLRLLLPFETSPLNQQVDVFAGCDHTLATCDAKFDNVINYGGNNFVPLKDIFRNGLQ